MVTFLFLSFLCLAIGSSTGLVGEENEALQDQETMYDQHFLAAGVRRDRQKRGGLGLLERLNKVEPDICEDTPCPRGLELHTRCNFTIDHQTLCIPCRYQYYKEEKSFDPCRPCSACAPGQVVSRWCTTKRNTMCSGDYKAPPPKLIEAKMKWIKKAEIPSVILTVLIPCSLLLAVIVTAIVIYVRIKIGHEGKVPDKAPLTKNADMDCCYGDEAGPLPTKVTILDPKALPASINITSPMPSGSRLPVRHFGREPSYNSENSYEFSFQTHHPSENGTPRVTGQNLAENNSWMKRPASWRKFCSTPNIPDTCDAVLEDTTEEDCAAGLLGHNSTKMG